jgi:hypothetical protein
MRTGTLSPIMLEPDLRLTAQDDPFTEVEIAEARRNARERLGLWKKRLWYCGPAFTLSCAFVYPFLYGHSLHPYWESFGKYLVLLSMGLLLPFVYCAALTWVAWKLLRDLEEGYGQLPE